MSSKEKGENGTAAGAGQEEPEAKGWTAKRVIALAAVILLLALYVLTFIAALFSSPGASGLFRLCLGMTIAVPVFAWVAIWAVGAMRHRHTIASPDIRSSNPQARREMEEALQRQMNNDQTDSTRDQEPGETG